MQCGLHKLFINDKAVAPEEEVEEKVDGKTIRVINPAYKEWFASDQQVLGFLFSSLSSTILSQVATAKTAHQAWQAIQEMFASHTRARTVNVRLALATTKKEDMMISQYYSKMKSLGDEMAAAWKPLEDEEMTSYILNGLDPEYNPLVSALVTRVEPISMTELYSQLLSFETRLEIQQGGSSSSANSAQKGGHGGAPRGGYDGYGRGCNGGRGRGQGGRGRGPQQQQRQSGSNQQQQQR